MNPELIISTGILETDELPVIVIDPMFKDYDVIKINSFINQIEHKESNTYDFMNLFKEDLFFKDIDANNQYEVINSLFDILKKSGRGNEQFLQAVFDRESISSTYIGNMVAIPHAIGVNIGENVVAIGITKKPINWQNDKVQLIFLINIRNASEGKVKQIFNSFFEVINSRRKVERLIKSENFYEFIKTISS
jgi:mannitol/fructose-specific phosphotransferase system IIA component (Ntr-type)